jgi:hypothetical protein
MAYKNMKKQKLHVAELHRHQRIFKNINAFGFSPKGFEGIVSPRNPIALHNTGIYYANISFIS